MTEQSCFPISIFFALMLPVCACSTSKDNDVRPDTGHDTVDTFSASDASETADSQTDPAADVVTGQDIKVVGVFEDRCAIPDCDAIAATNPDFVPQPGVNCWDGHLKYWLADAKSMFVAAAIIDVGTVFETREIKYSDVDNTEYLPVYFSSFTDTKVRQTIFGNDVQDGLIVGNNFGTDDHFGIPAIDNYHVEDWFVYPGEALAFFGFDCVIDAAYPGVMSIYRLFPIRDGQVLDYDARPMPLQDVVTAINSGIVERPDGYPTFGYSSCPTGLKFLP